MRRGNAMRLNVGLVAAGLMTVMWGVGAGCGSSSPSNQQDAAVGDAPVQFDAAHDVAPAPDDAGPTCGSFYEPSGCGWELSRCTVKKENSDECGGDLDCVDSGLYGLVCLRKCNCSAECGFNTICLPAKTTDYSDTTAATQIIGAARGHCFYSFCGGEGDSTSPFGNGSLFGACDLGKDGFIKAGKVDTRPGTCFPLSTHVPEGYLKIGLCQQAGSAARGAACSFTTDQCADPTTYDACAVGSVCIGRRNDATGTCAKLCDPKGDGFNPAVTGGCAADSNVTHDQYCQDTSSYQRDCTRTDGGVDYGDDIFYTHLGFCVDSQGCDALSAANTCANVTSDGGVALHSCEPTNPIDPNGLCGDSGDVGPHGTCNGTLLCQPGYVCITTQSQSQGTCEKYCGMGENDGKLPCAAGEVCTKILYGSDPSSACDDDPWTLNFGICRPDTRQDGGVEPDGAVGDAAPDDATVPDAQPHDGGTDT
jgi:hypothetical protein